MSKPLSHAELYEQYISDHPTIKMKGAVNRYTSVNGHMCSAMNKAGEFGLRLSKEDRESFIERHGTELFVSYNTIMKEYVRVPDEVMRDPDAFRKYLDTGYAYVLSLKPKPTTRKKK